MNVWVKTGEYTSLEDYFEQKSGVPVSELLNPPATRPEEIENLVSAAKIIQRYINKNNNPVIIFGDYDADGLTATAILSLLFSYLNVQYQTVIPRRMSDGYGVSPKLARGLTDSLIITVDNGITALEAISLMKENRNTVIVMDHHLPAEELPKADVIVDPHVNPEKNGFVDYCGAGLAYKLMEYLLGSDLSAKAQRTLQDALALAAVGTIADVVPLVGDNRRIVMEGLRLFEGENRESLIPGLHALADIAGEEIDEETIAYRVAPLINAPGRLYDRGGESVLKLLLCQNLAQSYRYARKVEEINAERKELVEVWYEKVRNKALHQAEEGKCPIVVFQKGMPAGIVGIVTGKLAESLHVPAFVFAQEKDGEPVKGSGRSYGPFDISSVLPALKGIVVTAGGHKGAAGITVEPKNYIKMVRTLQKQGKDQDCGQIGEIPYDMVLDPKEAGEVNQKLKMFRPFGAGVPRPVFVIQDAELENSMKAIQFIGGRKEHVRLGLKGLPAVGFYMAQRYQDEGAPFRLNLLGSLSENTYKGVTTDQFIIEDFQGLASKAGGEILT